MGWYLFIIGCWSRKCGVFGGLKEKIVENQPKIGKKTEVFGAKVLKLKIYSYICSPE